MAYSVAPPAAGTINAATGVMDWDAAFSGTATITANATGLCGTTLLPTELFTVKCLHWCCKLYSWRSYCLPGCC
ncbi:MAG: hypothetical protein MZU84_00015 [Sphingobacterium sp.]|nr:hypothetical protein [Sphingobacterium sp.]